MFHAQLGIDDRHRAVHRDRMSAVVGRMMRERAKRERIFVDGTRFPQQRFDEITRTDVVDEI
jgi:hypothetical protein